MRTPAGISVIGFCAYSGSGKTTLATAVISLLRSRGVRVGVIKHAHHDFNVDVPGKDSYELRKAGAVQTLVSSSRRWALVTELDGGAELGLEQLIERLALDELDLVLVEGFKHEPFPKIEILRLGGEGRAIYPTDPHVVAVATDVPAARLGPNAGAGARRVPPLLDLNDPTSVADFVAERILKATGKGGGSIPTGGTSRGSESRPGNDEPTDR